MNLFGREAELITNGMTIPTSKLDMEFEVPFDDNTEPNESRIRIFNMSDNSINRLKRNEILILNAGYRGDVGTLLKGRISKVLSGKERINRQTTSDNPDKLNAYTDVFILDGPNLEGKKIARKTYKKGIKASQIFADLLPILGVKASVLNLPTNKVYPKGYVVNEPIIKELRKVAIDCGASMYFNRGLLYVRPITQGDNAKLILSSDTGLIGTPEPFSEEKNGKKVNGFKVTCLLQYRITTSALIELRSTNAKGLFRVRKGTHKWTEKGFLTECEVVSGVIT